MAELKPFAGNLDAAPQAYDGPLDGEAPKPAGALRRAADTGLALGRGIVAVPETAVGISDLITGGRTGKAVERLGVRFKDAKQVLTDFQSDDQKAADARVQQADGFLPTVGAMIENPSTIANAVAESAPSMLAGGAVSRGLVNKGVSGITAGAVGEGVVSAGQAAEQVRQEGPTGFLTPKQAALAATSGAATGVINRASGKLANQLGIGDINTAMATGKFGPVGDAAIAKGAEKGFVRRVAEGAANEGLLQEVPQSMQEQAAQNLALDKPLGEGVGAAAAAGLLVGGLTGGAVGAVPGDPAAPPPNPGLGANSPSVGAVNQTPPQLGVIPSVQGGGIAPAAAPPAPPAAPPPSRAQAMGIDPAAGPLSAGAAIAVDTGADVITQTQEVEKQKAEAAAKEKAKPGADGKKPEPEAPAPVQPVTPDPTAPITGPFTQAIHGAANVTPTPAPAVDPQGPATPEGVGAQPDAPAAPGVGADQGPTGAGAVPAAVPEPVAAPITPPPTQESTNATQQAIQGETIDPETGEIIQLGAQGAGGDGGQRPEDALQPGADAKGPQPAPDQPAAPAAASAAPEGKPAAPTEPLTKAGQSQEPAQGVVVGSNPRGNLPQGQVTSQEQINGQGNVPVGGLAALGGNRADSANSKGAGNGKVVGANASSNLGHGDAIESEGFRTLDVPTQSRMFKLVLSLIHDDKVFKGVIESVPVDVMDQLASSQGATKMSLHDRAMFIHALSAINNLDIRSRAIDALVGSPAFPIAELKAAGDEARRLQDSRATAGAGEGDGHKAATSWLSDKPHPTTGQRRAGNYEKRHTKINGVDISIENEDGTLRTGVDSDGKAWSTKMQWAYGYAKRTVGSDDEQQDVFVKPGTPLDYAGQVFVVDQIDPKTGKHDEYKSMVGAKSPMEARKAYMGHYAKDWKGLKNVTALTWDQWREWLQAPKGTAPSTAGKPAQDAPAATPQSAPTSAPSPDTTSSTTAPEGPAPAQTPAAAPSKTESVSPAAAGPSPDGTPATTKSNTLRVGTMPTNAEPVTIKDGVIFIGKYEALNFDTGEPVRIAPDANPMQIRKALADNKALGTHQKVFGGVAPTDETTITPDVKTAPVEVQEPVEPAAQPEPATALNPLQKKVKEARQKKAVEAGNKRPTAAQVLDAAATTIPYGKAYTNTEGIRQKGRIITALTNLGLKPGEAQTILDRAMTTEARRRMPNMRFILPMDVRNAADDLGYTRLPDPEPAAKPAEPAAPIEPKAAPASINTLPLAERWDALVAHTKTDGGDPDKGQRSYRAFTQLVGSVGEKPMDVWGRWSSSIGSTEHLNRTGPEVLKWMESNLVGQLDGYNQGLPGNQMGLTTRGDTTYWQRALDEIERRSKDHNNYMDRLEKQARDVEELGGDAKRVAEARATVMASNKAYSANERRAREGLKEAEVREKEKALADAAAEAAKYKPFDAKELSKKPTPGSMSGWFTANYEGKTVWTQGTILDVGGTPPHLIGYQTRMDTLGRNKDGKLDVSRVIPRQKGPQATPFGFYDGEYGKSANGLVYFDAEGRLIGVNTTFFRYFASKYKGAEFFASPDGDAITVRHDGKTVGVIMPIRITGAKVGEAAPTVADIKAKIGVQPAAPAQDAPRSPEADHQAAIKDVAERRRKAAEAVRASVVKKTNANSAMVWQIIGPDGEAVSGPPGSYPGRGPLAGTSTMGNRGWKTKGEADAAFAELNRKADEILGKEPAKARTPNKMQQRIAAIERQRADYFTPGNIVQGYGGYDRVISYTPGPTWSVKVVEVRKTADGWVDVDARNVRNHSTQPEPKEFARGPIGSILPKASPVIAPAAKPENVLSIEMGGGSIDLTLDKPAWTATPDEVKGAVQKAGFSHEAKGSYDPMRPWYEAHSEALAAAAKEGKVIPDNVLYERPGLIRTDLNDDQADLASDAMVSEYRDTKDYAKAVQAYRDFGKQPAATNTENAGAELTYNKRNRVRTGIKWSDIADKDVALRVSETTKSNVSPKPDYQAMVDGGMEPIIAHLVKQAYDSLSAGPNTGMRAPTDADLQGYIDGVQRYMAGVMAWAENPAQTRAWILSMGRRAGVMAGAVSGTPTSLSSMAQTPEKSLIEAVYPTGWRTHDAELRLIGGNKALQGLQPSTDHAMKATKDIGKGWPAKQEAWQKQGYSIVSGDKFAMDTYAGKDHHGEPYVTVSIRMVTSNRAVDLMQKTFDGATAKDDPQAMEWGVQAIESIKGKHLLLGKYNRLKGAFDTQEAAQEKARELTKRDGKTTVSDKGISVEEAQREGVQYRMSGEDISSDRLKEAFGLKGVNFGNWMLGDANIKERQMHLNHAYDSFMDLAGVLGVPPKALSLNGMLGLAIGAQGTGKYAAHFVPGVNEINLTRTSGAGSLAHEFGHGLDHYFARLASLTRTTTPFLTEHVYRMPDGAIRPEIFKAFQEIVQAMNKRPTTQAETTLRKQESLKKAKKQVEGWLAAIRKDFERLTVTGVIRDNKKAEVPVGLMEKFDALADRIKAMDLGDGAVAVSNNLALSQPVSDIRDLYKQATGRVYSLDQTKSLQSNIDHAKYLTDSLASTEAHVPQMVTTDYATAAAKLDKDKGGERYWSTDLEKFARAFDAFVSDKLEAAAAKNTYLSHAGRTGETVPTGTEREAINAGIQKLVDTIQTKEDDVGNVAMFARGTKRTGGVHMDDAEAIIAQTREALPTAPPIIPLESIAQAPADLRKFIRDAGAQDDFEAAYHNGKIYVLPSNVGSTTRLQFLLAHHEIRHHGLGAMLGPRKNAVMFAIHATNANVRAAAAEQVRKGYAASKVLATEEALADMPVEDLVKLNGWDKIVAAVREWLRGAAMRLRRVGLANVADAIEPSAWTDKDVAALVARAEGVSRGGSAKYATEGTVFGQNEDMANKDVVGNNQGGRSADDQQNSVPKLQAELRRIEARQLSLKYESTEWNSAGKEAASVRVKLFNLTGDYYGKPKVKISRPSDDALEAQYASPDEVPSHVRKWVRQHANTLTSDATDAVRWGRIADTLADDRYPAGDLTIYRAVADGDGIRPGDWVTTDRKYAEDHLSRYLNGRGAVIEDTVDGRDVLASPTGNSEEAIYAPRKFSGPISNDFPAPDSGGALFARGGLDGVTDKINTTTKTASNAATLSSVTDTIKTAISPLGTVNLWDRTVGTQYNKATKDRDFKRVFDAFVQQTDDTAHYAIEAETKAPSILMRIDTVKDALKAVVKNGKQQAEDLKVVSKALFANIEGEEGVKSTRYDDDTLRILFGATPRQIEMYHQARAAIDTSIERLAQTYAAQMGGAEGMDMDQVKDMDMADTVEMVKQFIQDKHDELRAEEALRKEVANEDDDPAMDETRALAAEFGPKPAKAPSKAATARLLERLDAMQEQTTSLQQAGYMPAMRFGRFAVTVREPDADEVTHFEMFETRWEANLAAARLQREYPKAEVTKGVMNPEQYAMFKGVSPETVELFAKFTGADQTEAYQDYIALAKSARSVMKRQLKRKGIAGFSQDATRVMAAFVTSNARQSAINMNIGEITDALASQELARKGDVQREAQKLSEYMSNPLEEARRLRGFMFMHFMGGSVASALVNLTQPILQTAPYLHQFAGAKTASIMASSAKMAATGAIEDKELDAAAKRAREDGITEPHEIHQLMADAGTSTFGNNLRWRAGVKLWASMFSQAESFNRRITFLAAYQVAKQTGKPDPYDFARRAVIETQGLYSKVNRPNWARGAVGATIFTFKQFSIAYLEWLNRLPNKQKVIALAILTLAAGSEGWPFADDLEDLIDTIGQSLGYNTNSKKAKRKFLEETFGQTMGEILNTGVFSQSTVDLSGRLGMGNLLPATAAFKPSETDKARTISELAGPIAGVLQQFQRALGKAQQGDITGRTGALSQIAPVAVSNALKGMDMAATGIYKDTRGYKVADVDAWESFAKMLGLQPASIALQSRKFSDELQDKGMTTMMEAMIADRWAAGVVDKDLDAVASARDALRTWNEKNPESRIVIKPAQIFTRVKKMRETRDDRFLKTVPRENRALAARELQ